MAILINNTTGTYTRSASGIGSGDYTVTCWINVHALTANQIFHIFYEAAFAGFAGLAMNPAGTNTRFIGTTLSLTQTLATTANSWRFIASAYAAGGSDLYDGVAGDAALTVVSGTVTPSAADSYSFGIGAVSAASTNFSMAAVKVWAGTKMTAAEVEAERWHFTPQKTDGLWAFYPFDAGLDTADYSGNGRTLTAGGSIAATDNPPITWARRSLHRIHRPAAGGVNGTATPAVTARVVAVPAVTATGTSAGTATPTVIARTVATPTVTKSAGATVSPAAIATTVALPAVTTGAVTVTDNFNRADGALGANWTNLTGEAMPTISGNKVVAPLNVKSAALWATDLGVDQWAQITGSVGGGYAEFTLLTRFNANEEGFVFSWTNDGSTAFGGTIDGFAYQLWRGSGGGGVNYTLLAEAAAPSTEPSTLLAYSIGSRHVLWADGNIVIDHVDATAVPGRKVGFSLYAEGSPVSEVDNWSAGDTTLVVAVAGTATPAVIARTVTVPAATPNAGTVKTPALIARTVAIPVVATTAGTAATAAPTVIARTVAVPAVSPRAGTVKTPAVISRTVTIGTASATGASAGTATPTVITRTILMPTVTASGTSAGFDAYIGTTRVNAVYVGTTPIDPADLRVG